MPRFEPFPAWRYSDGQPLAEVTAPPYDVLSGPDVDRLTARNPHNIVRVDVPRGGPDRYAHAAQRLLDWQRHGIISRDALPSFTLYRMSFHDATGSPRETVGVIGALEVVDPGAGGVLPHERTTPKASTDRLDLTRATSANLSPVWGLSLAPGLTDLLRAPGTPMGEVVVDGVRHVVERVEDPARVRSIGALVGSADVLIADGHHRYGVARQYRDENPGVRGAGLTLAYVAELAADQLAIDAIHRLYRVDPVLLRAALSTCFEIVTAPTPGPQTVAAMQDAGMLVLHTRERTEWLIPQDEALAGVRALDGAWLEHALAGLGRIVEYQHGVPEVLEAVESGRADAAVLIRPTTISEITRTATEGLLMPPKSTFFTPKLRTGFVLRYLADSPV